MTTEHAADPVLRPEPGPNRNRIGAFLRLMRAENCVMAGCATLVGAGTATATAGSDPTGTSLTASVAAVMLVLAFGNVVNDVSDQEADGLGKSGRPLPSGQVSVAQAASLAAILLVGALAVTALAAPRQLPFVAAMCVVAALYSPHLKRTPLLGNAVFAAQCGATLVFGAHAAGGVGRATMAAAVLVAVGILSVEVAKTVEDHDADRRVGTRTIAHLVAVVHHRRLVGGFAAAYLVGWWVLWLTARDPLLFSLAAAPVVPLLAFALLDPGPSGEPPAARVPRFIVASKCLWPLALVAVTGL
ncbi:MAG: geranylgeranylglycerol-phosphate geranylgeranyltransferase [Actinomycetota bacterium]|jgi:4-hydroxybenzoate polyprenyltransferase|nr:geranylgeranylglycerol-phosphate geranylgeranyltransferase [Actinomycetota bacterium]